MRKILASMLGIACLAVAGGVQAATYTYTGVVYTSATGVYSTSQSITGSFTTATPLASNITTLTDVGSQVTSYSFSDGVTIYSSADTSHVRRYSFQVQTNSSGQVTGSEITLHYWQTAGSTHTTGNLFNFVSVDVGVGNPGAQASRTCDGPVSVSATATQDADTCTFSAATGTSYANAPNNSGTWTSPTPPSTPVPTLGGWAMVLATLMAGTGLPSPSAATSFASAKERGGNRALSEPRSGAARA